MQKKIGGGVFYSIYILNTDISEENKKRFYSLKKQFPDIFFEIIFLDAQYCDEMVRSWNVPDHRGSYVTYYKLLLDHYFADTEVERIIHVGADTLILGDLSELDDFDFQGQPIAMNWSERLFERHFPHNFKYCIAEMIYFNLPEWRKHHCEERVRLHIREIGDIYGSKDQGILNMEFQEEITQLPLKYNVYGITFYFHKHNKIRFNNAPVISRKEILEAYRHPEIVHIPRTFLYRPHEEGSREPLKKLWWKYCKSSPWKDLQPYPVYPPLGAKEKFLRTVYLMLPSYFAEWFYVVCRHGYGFLNSIKCKPLVKKNIGIVERKSD